MAGFVTRRRSSRQSVPSNKYKDLSESPEQSEAASNLDLDDCGVRRTTLVDSHSNQDFLSEHDDQHSEPNVPARVSAQQDRPHTVTLVSSQNDGSPRKRSRNAKIIPIGNTIPAKGPAEEEQKIQRPQLGNTRSKGIHENPLRADGQLSRVDLVAGPGKRELESITATHDLWINCITLPLRIHMQIPLSHSSESRLTEAKEGWDWYYNDLWKASFCKQQLTGNLLDGEFKAYLPAPHAPCAIFMGPYGHQTRRLLTCNEACAVNDFWPSRNTATDKYDMSVRTNHRGWVVNLGCKITCLDWAWNNNDDRQYLAVATRGKRPRDPYKDAPAFTSAGPVLAHIQIWSFDTRLDGAEERNISRADRSPRLELILCHDWGSAKQIKWCPMPRIYRKETSTEHVSIGLLAGVFDDGTVRILDIHLRRQEWGRTNYVQASSASFTAYPSPSVVSTCMTWLSAVEIAVGDSSGFLSVYSMLGDARQAPSQLYPASESCDQNSPPNPNNHPVPWFHERVHQTYITCLASAYPDRPTIIASTSMSGHTRLTSLSDHFASNLQSRRTHHPCSVIAYHSALYGFIYPDDGKEVVFYSGLRFWGNAIGFGDVAGWGNIGCLDVGKAHVAVAYGTADGRVVVTNPMRRVLYRKEPGYQQVVFRHEWIRKLSELDASQASHSPTEAQGQGHSPIGLCRITEGYKAQKCDPDQRTLAHVIPNSGRSGRGNTATSIFEEETATTAVCWNPNVPYGGWLAVGWGSGLLRVQDVAV